MKKQPKISLDLIRHCAVSHPLLEASSKFWSLHLIVFFVLPGRSQSRWKFQLWAYNNNISWHWWMPQRQNMTMRLAHTCILLTSSCTNSALLLARASLPSRKKMSKKEKNLSPLRPDFQSQLLPYTSNQEQALMCRHVIIIYYTAWIATLFLW